MQFLFSIVFLPASLAGQLQKDPCLLFWCQCWDLERQLTVILFIAQGMYAISSRGRCFVSPVW